MARDARPRLARRPSRSTRSTEAGGVPTVDLTVHMLNPEAIAALAPESFVLVEFWTRAVQGGYLEEDGEIWSEDGILLAQARQVGVVL